MYMYTYIYVFTTTALSAATQPHFPRMARLALAVALAVAGASEPLVIGGIEFSREDDIENMERRGGGGNQFLRTPGIR